MSRIESEAMSVLLHRRQSLQRGQAVPHDLARGTVLTDEHAPPEAPSEGVQRELVEIEEALGRIAAGRYGTCLACGGPLGLQRLRAIPEARFCLGCSGHRVLED
jgi:RNA polymerase-binding transcription factor DksA